jgi:pantetheine-phosphate adenylyltransferase
MKKTRKTIGLGGTFDHFHRGHREFLRFAADLGSRLVIGVTAEHMTQGKQYARQIQSYHQRVFQVRQFCQSEGISHEILKLEDLYGPTLEPRRITELAVTDETQVGAQQINDTREAMNLRRLPVNVFHRVAAEDGEFISSSRIRAGRIDREGRVYAQLFENEIILDEAQRDFFSQVQGEFIEAVPAQKPAAVPRRVVVGDVSLTRFLERGWEFDLGIFDRSSQRAASDLVPSDIFEQALQIENPAGSVQPKLAAAIRDTGRRFIQIDGEEDLAVIPAVLLTALGSEIYYGQPDEGLVRIRVSEEIKQSFADQVQSDQVQ